MQLIFKQRFFSWLDSYDIYDERGNVVYEVKGQLSWGHCLKIFDADGYEVGAVKEKIFSFRPRFEIYTENRYLGCITKELTLFKPAFSIDFNGWQVDGNIWEWNYLVCDNEGYERARISKQLLNWTDTYVLDIALPEDALPVLMLTLAIDAEKCTSDS